jgi:hypothetical protein
MFARQLVIASLLWAAQASANLLTTEGLVSMRQFSSLRWQRFCLWRFPSKRTPSSAQGAFTGPAARVRAALSSPIGPSQRPATIALAFASADKPIPTCAEGRARRRQRGY